MAEAKTKTYQVRLVRTFKGNQHRRAGLVFNPGAVYQEVDLTPEQYELIKEDAAFEFKSKSAAKREAALEDSKDNTPPADESGDATTDGEDTKVTPEVSADMPRVELEKVATDLGIEDAADKEKYETKADLIAAINEKATPKE